MTGEPRAEERALDENVTAIAELERRAIRERSTGDRASDAITRVMGSAVCVVLHAAFFGFWIAVNTGVLAGIEPFDPFPFSLLTLVVSLEAIILSLFVLMAQSRMTREADKRAHLDLQVDLLAERELTAILQMVQALCKKQGVSAAPRDERIDELSKKTDVRHIADALDQQLSKG